MDTIRWSNPDGDFTISNSGGRLLIGIEPKDGSWHSIWADWGWEGSELGLHEPLEWDDEHGNRARAAFGLGNAAVRVSIRVEGDDRSLDDAPSVLLDREHWMEAVDALLQPTGSEFWARVAAAQPPQEALDEDDELPEVRWTTDGANFVITDHSGDWLLSIETDEDSFRIWGEDWDAEALQLGRPLRWEDVDGWRGTITRIATRRLLRRRDGQVQILIGFENQEPAQVTLSDEQWAQAAEALTAAS